MALSLLRGLTANLLSNVSGLKKQAKRLHKAAPSVFGHDVALDTCQEAIARAHGFERWSDVSEIALRAGIDRSLPFWYIHSRNDFHEKLVAAAVTAGMELWNDQPLALLGDPDAVAPMALCLWSGFMSIRKVPGILLINTEHPSFEDTALGKAVNQLGLDDIYSRFRVIDARERRIPGAVSATATSWQEALSDLLPQSEGEVFEAAGGNHLLRSLMTAYAQTTIWMKDHEDLPFDAVRKAMNFMLNPQGYRFALLDSMKDSQSLAHDIDRYLPQVSRSTLDKLKIIVDDLDQREFGTGTLFWSETKHRPTIVLFNRSIPASEVIASVMHDMFYARYVFEREIRPTLYFSDTGSPGLPKFIGFGSETVIANGSRSKEDSEWQAITMRRAMFADIQQPGVMVYSGRRVDIAAP